MILKKPYAFFIKMFKPIHLILSVMVVYLFYLTNNILIFLNQYIYSSESLISKDLLISLTSKFLYVIPIVIILFFFVLLGIMYKKKKPIIFYLVGIFVFIVILVINIYTGNFLVVISENIVSVRIIKLIHDLILINLILECLFFILLFIRGLGVDFKKFDFSSDISRIQINESDKEEFEVNINIDFNEKRRKKNKKLRDLKYLYFENKFLINIVSIVFLLLMASIISFVIIKNNKVNKEGIYYSANSFDFRVNSTVILNEDYKGNKITDNYLIVVDVNIKSKYFENSLYLNDFSLKIENIKIKPTKKYIDYLVDLGVSYDERKLSLEDEDYIFTFEIPEKYINSDMYFSYNSEGNIVDVLVKPKELMSKDVLVTKNINSNIEFDDPLKGVKFNVNSYELSNMFVIDYNYCIKDDDCIPSKEYLKPSIDENYDKVILKLNVNYEQNGVLNVKNFYSLLSNFGGIAYKKNGTWYVTYKFEEITSTKKYLKEDVYIGVHSNVMMADSIKLIFNIRNLKYEYILK